MNRSNSRAKKQFHSKNRSQAGNATSREDQSKQLHHASSLSMMFGHRKTQSLKTELDERPAFGCVSPMNNRANFTKNSFCYKIPELSKLQDLQIDPYDIDNITSIQNNSKRHQQQLKSLKKSLQEIIMRNQDLAIKCEFLQHENILERQKLDKLNKENLQQQNFRLKYQLKQYLENAPLQLFKQLNVLKQENRILRLRIKTSSNENYQIYNFNKKYYQA